MKKEWTKPEIKTELKIKETLSKGGSGGDGGPQSNKQRS